MKYLFAIIIAICLYSCTSQTALECAILKERVAILEARVDSLVVIVNTKKNILNDKRTVTQKKKREVGKNSDENNFNENAFSENSSVERTYKTSYSTPKPTPRKNLQYSSRCQATTKKGYQCSRNARSGGYCWQHGG